MQGQERELADLKAEGNSSQRMQRSIDNFRDQITAYQNGTRDDINKSELRAMEKVEALDAKLREDMIVVKDSVRESAKDAVKPLRALEVRRTDARVHARAAVGRAGGGAGGLLRPYPKPHARERHGPAGPRPLVQPGPALPCPAHCPPRGVLV